jgi:hypothetical protein
MPADNRDAFEKLCDLVLWVCSIAANPAVLAVFYLLRLYARVVIE